VTNIIVVNSLLRGPARLTLSNSGKLCLKSNSK